MPHGRGSAGSATSKHRKYKDKYREKCAEYDALAARLEGSRWLWSENAEPYDAHVAAQEDLGRNIESDRGQKKDIMHLRDELFKHHGFSETDFNKDLQDAERFVADNPGYGQHDICDLVALR